MIVVTGAAGFIGSCLVSELNAMGKEQLILVDDFTKTEKANNLLDKKYVSLIERSTFFDWANQHTTDIEVVFHLGARTDTTEFNTAIFDELNLHYSQQMWHLCSEKNIPLIYASSAATYGAGEYGYIDNHELPFKLKPLNPYGDSKNDFDKWAIQQEKQPPFWAGMKFFNVYGPNEYHKGRMASVIFHAFHQIQNNGKMKLFKSHKPEYTDGGQMRDFIYVKDVVSICLFLYTSQKQSGLYNVGTGKAETFLELALSTFAALNIEPNIEFVDTPLDIRDKYQYFTEADMSKLKGIGYSKSFFPLRQGINDYVVHYLSKQNYC
jgi:ADP-L-glycero-D-manno-heptose 6-epimerase